MVFLWFFHSGLGSQTVTRDLKKIAGNFIDVTIACDDDWVEGGNFQHMFRQSEGTDSFDAYRS